MQSYMNSPQYQALLAQALQGGPASQYPGQAVANGLAQMVNAYALKQYQNKEEGKQADYAKALSGAFQPTNLSGAEGQAEIADRQASGAYGPAQGSDPQSMGSDPQSIQITPAMQRQPTAAEIMGNLMSSGNPEVLKDFGPKFLDYQIARTPKPQEPYTLNEGAVRYGANNAPLATNPKPIKAPEPYTLRPGDQRFGTDNKPLVNVPLPGKSPEPYTLRPGDQRFGTDNQPLASVPPPPPPPGADFGRSMQGKAYNILAQGFKDPSVRSTPEYATAWQILSNPTVDPNTGTMIRPDMSAFLPPAPIGGAGAAPGAQSPAGPRTPSIQSFAPPNPKAEEANAAGFANRLDSSNKVISGNESAGTNLYNRTAGSLPGGNYLVPSDYQQLDQAERNFVNAQLRRESGAVISPSEFENAKKQYFPQPGDSPQVLKQKKASRDMAVQNMALTAGNALLPAGVIQQSSPPGNAPIVPQNQGFGNPPAASSGWKVERVQ